MRNFIILFFAVLFVGCQQKQEKVIKSIEVLYYNYLSDRVISVDCDEIVYNPPTNDTILIYSIEATDSIIDYQVDYQGVLEAAISDRHILQEIAKELQLAKRTKDYGIDARMKCYIQFLNGEIDNICVNSSYTYGYYNGKPTKFTNKFAYLIRKNCGFYDWIGTDMMKYFYELNDTTFVREPVTNRWGESY